jgi:uncharacterized SAM-binding protein YcdF (DUF218 family)
MFFWLKKALTLPFLPLHFSLLTAGVGVVLLWISRWVRFARVLVSLAFITLLLASNEAVSSWLLAPLEARFAPIPDFPLGQALPPELAKCEAIVVLGGGHADGTKLSSINQLSGAALSRLAEGIRLTRLLPNAKLIVSGNNGSRYPSHAKILENAALSLGLEAGRIIRMDEPRDTEDEANGIARRIGATPFVLITSAWHLPRATALCERAGLHPLPCPADFMLKRNQEESFPSFGFDLEALERSTKAVHEYLGLFWARLRGKA